MRPSKIDCQLCGASHDVDELEPRYQWPELIYTVPREHFD